MKLILFQFSILKVGNKKNIFFSLTGKFDGNSIMYFTKNDSLNLKSLFFCLCTDAKIISGIQHHLFLGIHHASIN